MIPPGLIIAGTASGAGKTTVTLGLLRALRRRGYAVSGAKIGPDYIDPAFHAAATGRPAYNLDVWAMRPSTLEAALEAAGRDADLIVAEGVMGLFDGIGPEGRGSTAEVAATLGWPVALVLDARGASASLAATLDGFARHRPDVSVTGAIINRVGGIGHADVIVEACQRARPDVALLGCLPRQPALALPERHLGLVQATEHRALDRHLDVVADAVEAGLDIDLLLRLPRHGRPRPRPELEPAPGVALAPIGQRIAVASDVAFAFSYRLVIEGWRAAGAEVLPFSPLADEMPDAQADAVYLPGGYPELHAGRLAGNRRFLEGLTRRARRGAAIYGECGGYMVLGETLIDGTGVGHAMAGLLPLETSFAEPRLSLGYRRVSTLSASCLGPIGATFHGHEFHHSTILREGPAPALFAASDAAGRARAPSGLAVGAVVGSYVHLIDHAPVS